MTILHTLPYNIQHLITGLIEMRTMGYRSYSYEDYLKTMNMHRGGLGPTEISQELGIKKYTIDAWIYRNIKPPATKWIPQPSSELAYIIGVLNGDGSLYSDGHYYRIQLGVEDLEFAETFSKNMARLLNKKVVKPYWDKSNSIWRVIYCSKAFYVWYKGQTLKTLKQYIEYDKDTVANFLCGLYDSEGNHYKYKKRRYNQIRLCNNDKDLLKYVQHLLEKYFDINATGPYINVKAGVESKMGNGKTIKTKYDNYRINIYRKRYAQKFLSMIGFSIEEKQLGQPRRRK